MRVGKLKLRVAGLVGAGMLFQIRFTYCWATLLTGARVAKGVPAGRTEVQFVDDDALKQISTGKMPCFIAVVGTVAGPKVG